MGRGVEGGFSALTQLNSPHDSSTAVFIPRKSPRPHLIAIFGHRLANCSPHLSITFHKTRLQILEESEQIVRHQHLAVAIGTGADADRGDVQFLRNLLRDLGRNAFKHNGKRTGFLDGYSILEETRLIALDTEAAEAMDRLRRQADMAHEGNI